MADARRHFRTLLVLTLTGTLALAGAARAAEPVTKYIPDSAMGYVLMNNVEKSLASVEGLLKDIGVHEMLIQQSPEEGAPPVTLLSMIRDGMRLGKGFDPAGGFAAVLLDPADVGLDTMEVFGLAEAPAPATQEAAPAAAPKVRPEPPLVLLVPGKGVAEVFENFEPVADGPVWKLKMPNSGKPGYAVALSGYVALSPSKAAVQFLAKAKPASAALDPTALTIRQRGDLILHVNVTKVNPLLQKVMAKLKQEMASAADKHDKEMVATMLGSYEEMLKQMKSLTCSIRMTGDGIAMEGYVAAVPGTAMAKNFTSQAGVRGGAQTLACLPSLPYMLACGQAKAANPAAKAAAVESVDNLLKLEALSKVPDDLKARTRKLVDDYADEFTGVQVVIGGAPAAGGVFGVSIVVKCRDSEKVRNLMAEATSIAEGYIKSLVDDPKIKQLKMAYTRGAETIGGVTVDVLELTHPEIAGATEEEKAKFKKAMGEDKFVLRVAPVGKDAAVITIGGGQAMLTEAVNAAAGKGPIPTAPGTAAGLKHLPPNPSTVMLVSVPNILEVVRKGMTILGADKEDVDQIPVLKCTTPIAIGSQAMNDGGHGVIYIPSDLIREAVPALMGAVMNGRSRHRGPAGPMNPEGPGVPQPEPLE